LAQAEALTGTEREAFDNHLQAAIVFGRAVYHYLQSLAEPSGSDAGYREWFRAKSTAMKADPVLEYFRASRDLLLKERHVPAQRRIFGTGSVAVSHSMHGEGRVIRAQPWFRWRVRILWQDAKATVTRPVQRWRYRLGEAVKQRRRAVGQRVEAWRARWRNRRVVPTVREFYLDDPEGLDRPAVDLVRTYLDRMEAIVTEAETRFPLVVG
jgi:hypothetical protein